MRLELEALSTISMACTAMIGVATVQAQNFVSRPPSFQAPGQRSLQNEILDRLATTGQFQPDDLPRLSRLVVLNSIAMLVDVRTDLNQTTIGNNLDADIIDLSEASELYYESVSATSLDPPDIARASNCTKPWNRVIARLIQPWVNSRASRFRRQFDCVMSADCSTS